ncbi:cupin domain-containing protein [Ramlibacter sp. MAHUQ-53]|uniref:cupin domain-containing protein n=1 Tax=unclassified Ramlibacter TaxID=2617605 RepID=UPI00363CC707
MALPHARPLDVIDIGPLGPQLGAAVSTSLIKAGRLQLLHLVLRAHQDHPLRHVDDECTLHCLEGDVEVVMPGGVRRLGPGQLVLLPPGQVHGLRARADSAVLATLVLHAGDAGTGPQET